MRRPRPDPVGAGEESVWDYPRPPRLESEHRRVVVSFGGETIADTTRALRVLETSHPPTYYLHPQDVRSEYLIALPRSSYCEWKGSATYYDVVVGIAKAPGAAWTYPNPNAPFDALADHVAFYCALMDICTVGGEPAVPQPGGFYGGWVTSWVKGPFKGEPGTLGW